MRVLLTGFEAFAGNDTNPTQDLVLSYTGNTNFKSLVLPVSFEHAWKKLEGCIKEFKPQWVISCGVAAKRETIDLERVALNFIDASIVDNDGELISERSISDEDPRCYFSDLPLSKWKKELGVNRPVNVSLSAGSYVCNYIYFQLMAHRSKYQYQCIFIHFPYINNKMGLDDFKMFMNEFLEKIDSFTTD